VELACRHLPEVCAAVAPYRWRRFTPQTLARRIVGALDAAGGDAVVTLAERDDPRVETLIGTLDGLPWRGYALTTLCRLLLEALDDWGVPERWLDLEPAWLLDDGG